MVQWCLRKKCISSGPETVQNFTLGAAWVPCTLVVKALDQWQRMESGRAAIPRSWPVPGWVGRLCSTARVLMGVGQFQSHEVAFGVHRRSLQAQHPAKCSHSQSPWLSLHGGSSGRSCFSTVSFFPFLMASDWMFHLQSDGKMALFTRVFIYTGWVVGLKL
jgi:hypothetical protein